MGVGEFVSNSSSFRLGDDQTTAAQARQVIGNVGPSQSEIIGELRRICRAIHQLNEQPTTRIIGQRESHTCQHSEVQ
jgi:hypothetical protein